MDGNAVVVGCSVGSGVSSMVKAVGTIEGWPEGEEVGAIGAGTGGGASHGNGSGKGPGIGLDWGGGVGLGFPFSCAQEKDCHAV
jgi:hypothetical protein